MEFLLLNFPSSVKHYELTPLPHNFFLPALALWSTLYDHVEKQVAGIVGSFPDRRCIL